MLTIPLYFILFIYLAYLMIISAFTYVNFSHLFHGGALTIVSFLVTLLIGVLAVVTLYLTFIFLIGVDWNQPLTLWDNAWISNALSSSNY